MQHAVTPEIAAKLRLKFRTEYEFAVECGVLAENEPVNRQDVRDALLSLSHEERQTLQSRLRKRFHRLYELMSEEPRHFEEPYATIEDLPDDVHLTNEMVQ